MEIKEIKREQPSAHEYEMKIKEIAETADKDLWALGFARGYVGTIITCI